MSPTTEIARRAGLRSAARTRQMQIFVKKLTGATLGRYVQEMLWAWPPARFYLQQLPFDNYPLLRQWLGTPEIPFDLQPDFQAAAIFAAPAGVRPLCIMTGNIWRWASAPG